MPYISEEDDKPPLVSPVTGDSQNKTNKAGKIKLQEWIALQSRLLNIIIAFEPYALSLESANMKRTPLRHRDAELLWLPVQKEMQNLLSWAQSSNKIGQTFVLLSSPEGNSCCGEKWAVDIERMRQDMHPLMSPGSAVRKALPDLLSQPALFRHIGYLLGFGSSRWDRLLHLSRQFRHCLLVHINAAQKRIVELSTDL